MIRKNFSLASELRKSESKRQQKIQQRQKQQHNLSKLSNADPIKLYYKLQRARDTQDTSKRHLEFVKSLEADWNFIIKNNLHSEKLKPFLEKVAVEEKQKKIQESTNHGPKSIYYNPELNPFGLVPKVETLPYKITSTIRNYTKPLGSKERTKYEPDPIISELNIKPPAGDAPKFYKRVNFSKIEEVSSGFNHGSEFNEESQFNGKDETSEEPLSKRFKGI